MVFRCGHVVYIVFSFGKVLVIGGWISSVQLDFGFHVSVEYRYSMGLNHPNDPELGIFLVPKTL